MSVPHRLGIAIAAAFLATAVPAAAQTPANCVATVQQDPQRRVFECAGGIVIEAEAATQMGIVADDGASGVSAVDLESGGVLVHVPPGSGNFRIRSPHAIAAVRGTTYAVDATETATAVFVVEGEVTVSGRDADAELVLREGEGVDVTPGEPLVVRVWGAARVAALLARFGR